MNPVDWASVRADYEAGVDTIDEIMARHRITERDLILRRRTEGWTPRSSDPRRMARFRSEGAAKRRAEHEAAEAARQDWPAIRAAYESGEATTHEICRRFDVSLERFQRRRDRDGWLRLPRRSAPIHSGTRTPGGE